MTTNIGIYTKDFIQEDQYKAKIYEYGNCSLVSEYNYCIDCNHCIYTECLNQKNVQWIIELLMKIYFLN